MVPTPETSWVGFFIELLKGFLQQVRLACGLACAGPSRELERLLDPRSGGVGRAASPLGRPGPMTGADEKKSHEG
jgi:hypothetical protein